GYFVYAIEQCEGSIMFDDEDALKTVLQSAKGRGLAVVFGNEVKGVQQKVIDICDGCIEIPQYGTKHSMNVSVTAGIVMWEFAKRLLCPLIMLMLAGLFSACEEKGGAETVHHKFTTEAKCHITPVKNQGRSESCWIYAMLATIESNRIAVGDSINLSPALYESAIIEKDAERIYMNKGMGKICMRGMIPHTMRLIDRHGAFVYETFSLKRKGKNMRVVARGAERLARQDAGYGCGIEKFREHLADYMDSEIGLAPKNMYLYSMIYTPQEFGRSVVMPYDYSFYGADLQFPDRRDGDEIQQTSPKKMLAMAEQSLRKGYAVCWEGDISEPGFDWENGVADAPVTTEEQYRRDIARFKTTDDHSMELCGISHDEQGRKYFICKNSWGRSNRFKGLIFMSFDYFLAKTLVIGVYNR
ncbi:MAG: hypothetical protein HUK08_03620, partial [Bacteroidaceae bacterium]|nr:hypothetical protein [Bacteroidaceae bacterium]